MASAISVDPNPPTLVDFQSFDFNQGTMTLKFSKSVLPSSLLYSSITLTGRYVPQQYTLTGGSILQIVGPIVTIKLNQSDLNNIKTQSLLCTSTSLCNVQFPAGIITDFGGHGVVAFDEPVQTVTTTAITIQNAVNATINYTLSLFTPTISGQMATLPLSASDIAALKSNLKIAKSQSTTFMVYAYGLARDLGAGLPNRGVGSTGSTLSAASISPLQVRLYMPDLTPPLFTQFNILDFNTGTLTITFNEPVNISTFTFENITLKNNANSTVTLSSSEVAQYSASSQATVIITMSAATLWKAQIVQASSMQMYLEIDSGAIADTSGILLVAPNTLPMITFVADQTSPNLLRFDFDLNTATLVLSFDDIVDGSTIMYTAMTFQNALMQPAATYRLTNGPVLSTVNNIIQFTLSPYDRIAIAGISNLATNKNNTFLMIGTLAIQNLAGLNVKSITRQVTNFTKDYTNPSLLAFNLNLTTKALVLEFSKAVNISTLNVTNILLQTGQNTASSSSSVKLTGGTSRPNTSSDIVSIYLTQQDIYSIELVPGFANVNTTYLSIIAASVYDASSNPLNGIPRDNALMASAVTIDTTPPRLLSGTLDLNLGLLALTFDEIIITDMVTTQYFTLQNSRTPTNTYNLSNFHFASASNLSSMLNISLPSADQNTVKSIKSISISPYLIISGGAVVNLFNFGIVTIPSINAIQLQVIPDVTPPQLLLLNSTSRGSPISNYNLTSGSTVLSVVSNVLTVILSPADLDFIKLGLPSSLNLFISFSASLGADFAGNHVIPVSATAVTSIIPDTTPPQLLNFTLDLNSGKVQLIFNEPINTSAIVYTDLTLLSSTASVQLTDGSVLLSNQRAFNVTLTSQDLNAVKASQSIGLSSQMTFIVIQNATFIDVAGNGIIYLKILASSTVPDTTPPQLLFFNLRMDYGTLPLYVDLQFNEIVATSTLDVTKLILQDRATYPVQQVALSTAVLVTTNASTFITLRVPDTTSATIRNMPPLATAVNYTFLSAGTGLVKDLSNQIYQNATVALLVNYSTTDLVKPMLSYFTFDLNQGVLIFTFSKKVLSSTFNTSGLILLGFNMLPGPTLPLAQATVSLTNTSTPVVTVTLSTSDLNALKGMSNIATSANTTFIIMSAGIVLDPAGNPSVAISSLLPFQATGFIPDTTPPVLTGFSIDLNSAELVLTFSETVNVATFNPTTITLQNQKSSPIVAYALTGANTTATINTTIIKMGITPADLIGIRSFINFVTSISNTYLSVGSAVNDTSGNTVVPIISSNALQATSVNVDTAAPVLRSFSFDNNRGKIVLTFDEFVNISTLNVTQLQFQDNVTAIRVNYSLTSVAAASVMGSLLTVTLSDTDSNNLKLLSLCITGQDCYLSYTSATIRDAAGMPVTARLNGFAMLVSNFTPDTTPPSLVSFSAFNLGTGQVVLNLSEAINISSVNLMSVTIQLLFESPLEYHTLTGGSVSMLSPTVLSVTLTTADINFIKSQRLLCITRSTCYFSASASFLQDMSGNSFAATAQQPPGFLVGLLVNDNIGSYPNQL
ncbi:hypothetical protein EMCRGX_G018692 [Ephydatia muelleri]